MRRMSLVLFVGVLLLVASAGVWAQQQEAKAPVCTEFSNHSDRQAVGPLFGPGGALNGWAAHWVIYTDPPDAAGGFNPYNVFHFGGDHEVDALANQGDAYFHEVIANFAILLVSFDGDPGVNGVWYEMPGGARGIQWTHLDLSNVAGGPDPLLEDLDGLEVWGPAPGHDANYFSEIGELFGFSVLCEAIPWPGGLYVPQPVIVTAVQSLGYTGAPDSVDLDGLMVWDIDDPCVWGTGDIIIFSIRAAANWDGGEIVVLPFGGPASFLNHGGHLWNTAFDVSTAFGVNTEEVDGIEASWEEEPPIPTLTEWGLIIFGVVLLGFITWVFLRKRRAVASYR
jgi:hypothetical protein